ncbi:MAG: phosphotransferase [bacterium]
MNNPLFPPHLSVEVENILGVKEPFLSLIKLPGDASNREFYRLNIASSPATTKRSSILDARSSSLQPPASSLGPRASSLEPRASSIEHRGSSLEYPASWSGNDHPPSLVLMKVFEPEAGKTFLNVQDYLYRCQVPVPKLYGYHLEKGLIFMEDLGDDTLELEVKNISGSSPSSLIKYYHQAIDCLLDMQLKTTLNRDPGCLAFSLAFDVDKFMFEFDFFIQNVILKHKAKKIRPKDEKEIKKQFLSIASRLSEEPRYFTHRDYHSRNLLIFQDKIRMVDFQDARMGLCQYDLASLLRDSYVVLDNNLRADLINYYLDGKEGLEGRPVDRDKFKEIFDYTCLQRNLKAAGSFTYLTYEKNKPNFLQYLPDTFTYVKENLFQHPELTTLHQLLSEYVEEIR